MNISIIFTIAACVAMLCMFIYYERNNLSIKYISLIASLSSIAGLSRIPFTALPNIQPATFIIIISGYVFGPATGFMIGAFSVLVSNSILGHGLWTLWQMTAWGLAGFSAGILGKFYIKPNKIIIGLFAFAWGFLFGWIINIWYWATFVEPLNIATFLSTIAASFYFDLLHASGNFIFTFIFGKDLIGIINRVKNKIAVHVK